MLEVAVDVLEVLVGRVDKAVGGFEADRGVVELIAVDPTQSL